MKIEDAMRLVVNEYARASARGNYSSDHEGYAVMLEELDELWEEIKSNPRDKRLVCDEAVQVAATALRFLVGRCDFETEADRKVRTGECRVCGNYIGERCECA